MSTQNTDAGFPGFVDLAAERVGGMALLASDEFFAEKENLLKPGRGIFIADKYTERGKWMDGWESRRKRVPGYDWCVIELGLAGKIRGLDIDCNHFLGNHPPFASVEACVVPEPLNVGKGPDGDSKKPDKKIAIPFDPGKYTWTEILPKSPLKAGSQNLFPVSSEERWTHVRLNIYPDGGVARFRVYGDVAPDWDKLKDRQTADLASVTNGAASVACSDMFFSHMGNLIMPGDSENMGDGWETKRRRGPGHDWVIVRLGHPGAIKKVELFTTHFKGNFPDRASLDACYAPDENIDILNAHLQNWVPILAETKLRADSLHNFEALLAQGPFSHVRLNIYPDGGVARLRVYGTIA